MIAVERNPKTEVSTDDIEWTIRTTEQLLNSKPDPYGINIAMAEARREVLIELRLWPKNEKGEYV